MYNQAASERLQADELEGVAVRPERAAPHPCECSTSEGFNLLWCQGLRQAAAVG